MRPSKALKNIESGLILFFYKYLVQSKLVAGDDKIMIESIWQLGNMFFGGQHQGFECSPLPLT